MGIQAYVNVDKARKMAECTGVDCKDSESVNKAIDVLMDKSNPTPNTDKKLKTKVKLPKLMAMEHKHDIDYKKLAQEMKNLEQPIAQPTKKERQLLDHDMLNTTSKQGHCPGCNKMVDNPNFQKPEFICPECNQFIPKPQGKTGKCGHCGADSEDFEEIEEDE